MKVCEFNFFWVNGACYTGYLNGGMSIDLCKMRNICAIRGVFIISVLVELHKGIKNKEYLCSLQFFHLCYQVSHILILDGTLQSDTYSKIALTSKMTSNLTSDIILAVFVFCLCVFKVAHPDGLLLTATAAARVTRASARVRAALPSTSSPLPVPRPNQKPALPRKRSSCVRSPANPTSRLWTGRWKRVRPQSPGELTCFVCGPRGHVTPWQGRGNRPRRRWPQSRNWRNASRTSEGFKFQCASRRGSTCGSRSSWKNISSEMISCRLTEPISVQHNKALSA